MKAAGNLLYTAGIDDTLRSIDIATNAYAETSVVKLDSQPRGLDIYNDIAIVASIRQVSQIQKCPQVVFDFSYLFSNSKRRKKIMFINCIMLMFLVVKI